MSAPPSPGTPAVGVVVLSMGNRPAELSQSLASVQAQQGVELDVLVIGNGWRPEGLPAGVRSIHLVENAGIPGGRNVGAVEVRGELVCFFDDDATMPQPDVLRRLAEEFRVSERVAVVQPRLADPQGRPSPRRWVPRLRTANGGAPGDVVVFAEGVCVVRRSAFERVGSWPGAFWYGHEGIDLAFRLLDDGWRLRYRPDVVVHHPATAAQRHAVYYRLNARNRIWVARRNLPLPVAAAYVLVWTALSVLRLRRVALVRTWLRGAVEGWRTDPGPRRPIRWRTVLRLTAAGRPPII
ncbi:MAG: glycosyltransferase family 2 protein [Dermatophilaceae bacterium]